MKATLWHLQFRPTSTPQARGSVFWMRSIGGRCVAVDNIGDNRHNLLLKLGIFLTARPRRKTSRLAEIKRKDPLLRYVAKSDACSNSARDSRVGLARAPRSTLWNLGGSRGWIRPVQATRPRNLATAARTGCDA